MCWVGEGKVRGDENDMQDEKDPVLQKPIVLCVCVCVCVCVLLGIGTRCINERYNGLCEKNKKSETK